MAQPEKPRQHTDALFIRYKWYDVIKYLRVILYHMPRLDRDELGKSISIIMWDVVRQLHLVEFGDKKIIIAGIIANVRLLETMLQAGVEGSVNLAEDDRDKLRPCIAQRRYAIALAQLESILGFLGVWFNRLFPE